MPCVVSNLEGIVDVVCLLLLCLLVVNRRGTPYVGVEMSVKVLTASRLLIWGTRPKVPKGTLTGRMLLLDDTALVERINLAQARPG
jgi:hypothetical protein